MAQLSDDGCAGRAMTVEEAAALALRDFDTVAGTETVPLARADGRVAAQDVLARNALPPFDNAAVDGYALRHALLADGRETRLPLGGRIAAGDPPIPAGDAAVRIFTGAPMPPDADTVFMQEDVRLDGGHVLLPPGLAAGANRRRMGEDLACGAVAIPAGRRLRPQDLALAAACGYDRLAVRRPLRVALFSTGDELVEPGALLRPGAIHDANRVMLAALLGRLGAATTDLGILRDAADALPARLAAAAADHDLVLTSGGVSVGEEDHVKAAVAAVGGLSFWRLAIKPGRPVALGRIGATPFVGLPGNPVAAYVTLLFVVRPLLARLGGAAFCPPRARPVRAAFAHRKRAGRREYLRVVLREGADGAAEAHPLAQGSAMLASLAGSDGLAEIADAATAIRPGDTVGFHPHALLW